MSSSDRQRRHARRLSRSGRNTIMLPIDFYFDFASPYGFRFKPRQAVKFFWVGADDLIILLLGTGSIGQ
jgi:hypothetical protein